MYRVGASVPFLCRLLYPYTHSLVGLWSSGRIHLSMDGGTVHAYTASRFSLHHSCRMERPLVDSQHLHLLLREQQLRPNLTLVYTPDFISLVYTGRPQDTLTLWTCQTHRGSITKSFARRRLPSVPSTAVDVLVMDVLV